MISNRRIWKWLYLSSSKINSKAKTSVDRKIGGGFCVLIRSLTKPLDKWSFVRYNKWMKGHFFDSVSYDEGCKGKNSHGDAGDVLSKRLCSHQYLSGGTIHMKILVLNGSPKGGKSDVMHITKAFLKGMNEEEQHDVHVINIICNLDSRKRDDNIIGNPIK